MKNIILVNGPPSAGKDTVAKYFIAHGAIHLKFADPLKAAATAIYCNGDRKLFDSFDHDPIKKNTPDPIFFGKTCRQVQIDISEEFLKKMHGPKVFGDILKNKIHYWRNLGEQNFVISDSGFQPEAEVLINTFGAEKITLLRMHRFGCDFSGDSRGYIDLSSYGVSCNDIHNEENELKILEDKINYLANKLGV